MCCLLIAISLIIFSGMLQLSSFFEFCQVHRNCNFVADALAKKANHLGLQVWLEDMPEDIAPLVLFDGH